MYLQFLFIRGLHLIHFAFINTYTMHEVLLALSYPPYSGLFLKDFDFHMWTKILRCTSMLDTYTHINTGYIFESKISIGGIN